MKQITLTFLFATLLTLGLVLGAYAQSLNPSGCAQTTSPVLPWQDCQGALWVKEANMVVQVSNVRGPGCVANELPASSQTCLSTNERRTVWLMFEVQAPTNGPSYRGAPAGQLRFKIIPADVDHQALADNGQDMLGMTDFDFALFKITDKANRADACAAIKAATSIGTPGTAQVACNYSGLPGPTGLGAPGTGLSVDDQRYNRPLDVRVGDVFLLAVDNFSLNATYFRLLFGDDSATVASIPSAVVVPEMVNPTTAAALHMNKACGYGIELEYPSSIALDSLRTGAFALTYKGRTVNPTAITATHADELRGQVQTITLLFNQKLDTGTITLEQTGRLADRYGRPQMTFTRVKALRLPVSIDFFNSELCEGGSFKATTSALAGFGYGGWTTTTGFGPGLGVLGQFSLLNGAHATPGTHKVTYHFFWPEGCEDSVSVNVVVKAVPTAPMLYPTQTGALEAIIETSGTPQWKLRDSTFIAPALYVPTTGGAYRVRQIVDGCASNWSNAVALNVTEIRRIGEVKTEVFPNPATDFLNIRISGAQGSRVGVEVINAEGRTVLARSFANADWDYQVPVTGLAPGVYTLLLQTGTSITSHRVLVK